MPPAPREAASRPACAIDHGPDAQAVRSSSSAPAMIAAEIATGASAGSAKRSKVFRTAVQLVAMPVMSTSGSRHKRAGSKGRAWPAESARRSAGRSRARRAPWRAMPRPAACTSRAWNSKAVAARARGPRCSLTRISVGTSAWFIDSEIRLMSRLGISAAARNASMASERP